MAGVRRLEWFVARRCTLGASWCCGRLAKGEPGEAS
jgi:hypothetical protein